jgi:hypothetical protein
MSNRLIWLIIILSFTIVIGVYFYLFQEWSKNKKTNEIIQENVEEKILENKLKKVELVELKEIKEIEIKKSIISEDIIDKNITILKKISKYLNEKDLEDISIFEIYWEKNKFLIKHQNIQYIYNKKLANLEKIDFSIPIIYAKKSYNKNLAFITEKWTFTYSNKKELEYFSMFSDFVYINWDYVWIIKNNDKTRKNNFNFQKEKWDLIISKNLKSNKKRLLYKSDFEIKKILLKNNKIIIINSENKEFELDY